MSRASIKSVEYIPDKEIVVEPKKCISCKKSISKKKLLCERCFLKGRKGI